MIQPLLLQSPISSPHRFFGPQPGALQTARNDSAGAPDVSSESGAPERTRTAEDGPSRINQIDTVEISQEAEALLAAELTESEKQVVRQLKTRDRQVRAHEQAHVAAAGPFAQGGPTFNFETGPDGRSYAVGGAVQIDTSPVSGDPEATIRKAQTIRRAALAPAEPSGQDRSVAAAASQMEAQARQEIQQAQQAERQAATEQGGEPSPSTGMSEGTAPSSDNAPNKAAGTEQASPTGQAAAQQSSASVISNVAALVGTLSSRPGTHFDALA